MVLPTTRVETNPLHFEQVKGLPAIDQRASALPLPQGTVLHVKQMTVNSTTNIKMAPQHYMADIIHAAGRFVLCVTAGAIGLIATRSGTSLQNIQAAFNSFLSMR